MSNKIVIAVTGSNRGVGKGIVQLLAKTPLQQPLVIYATSRPGTDAELSPGATNIVHYCKLDITNGSSIKSFFQAAEKESGAIDVLINNAAISHDHHETPELAAETVSTNYGGTRDMCEAFLSQTNIRPGARIVNVTSGYNRLQTYGPGLQIAFRDAKDVHTPNELASAYLDSVRCGGNAQEQAGWGAGARSYKVSKALINCLAILLSKKHADVLINCCCPGWTDTEMGNRANGTPPKTIEQGARVPVRLAIGDLGPGGDEDGSLGDRTAILTGYFFENDSIIEAGWGKASSWLDT